MKNSLFILALVSFCRLASAGISGPGGDTVVVKMKNKNKVIILTEKNKDLGSLKNLQFDKIMMKVDSSLNLDSLMNLRVNVDIEDSDTIVENLPGGKKKMVINKVRVLGAREGMENEEKGERKMVRIMVKDGDTVRTEIVTKTTDGKPKVKFFKNTAPDDDMIEVDLGFNNYLQNGSLPADKGAIYGLSPFNSNIVNLRWMKRVAGEPGKTRFSASMGLELSWHNYKFDQNAIIGKDSASVVFTPFAANQKKIKSKLTISWLNVPLMLHYHAKKSSLHLALGGFAGYRLGSHSKTKFTEDGVMKKEKEYTNFYLNSLQYGLRFQVGFYDVDFFAAYHLNELFSSGKGPKLTPVSFGITL